MGETVAVIVDIVGSRRVPDRVGAQQRVRDAFANASATVVPRRPLWSTAGDEFQVEYATLGEAYAATAIVRVALDDDIDVRFGIGHGESRVIESGERGEILDGSAWWNARAAIEEVERRSGRTGSARAWAIGDGVSAGDGAALLLRDFIIGNLGGREKSIARALLHGQTQTEVARAEGISQSAVSQAAARSGVTTLVHVQSIWMNGNPA